MTTTVRRSWVGLGLAALLTAATAWAVLTFAVGTNRHTARVPVPAKLSASEQAYLRGLASMDYGRIAAAYNPAWRDEQSTATVLEELGPPERRYVHGILALTPEQLRAGFGTVRP